MAQWQELLSLDSGLQSSVSQLYEGKFPRDIRHWLSTCIESQDWDSAAVDENKAVMCLCALLNHLEEQRNLMLQGRNILLGPDFSWMNNYLLMHFKNEPLKLAMILSECLKEERKILASANSTKGCSNPVILLKWRELDNRITDMKQRVLEIKKQTKILESLNEKLDFIQKTWPSTDEQNTGLGVSKAVVEQECFKQRAIIQQRKQFVLEQLLSILQQASKIEETLLEEELPEWERRNQLACIGCPADTSLELLQKWFTDVAEVLLGVHELLQKLQEQNNAYSSNDTSCFSDSIAEIKKCTQPLITKLIENALVVERQPFMQNLTHRPLILKIGVRFTVTVRFLANLPDFKFLLKVKPGFYRDVEEPNKTNGSRLFEFTRDDSKVLDVDTPSGGLMAEFAHMSLKEKKTKSKGANESYQGVTEDLHIIRFETVLHHNGQTYNISARSLPVVVITSSSQVSSAWASIMWWNMHCTSRSMNLSLFLEPPPLPWQHLSQLLSWQFLSAAQRGLDEDQLSMLKEKLVDDHDDVHWNKFSKDESAWIWIDAILTLIKKHLADLWRDGHIMGFVSRQKTKLLLQSKPNGTFLIRFSESVKDGAITFSWVDSSTGESHVYAVEPYTKRELSLLSLPHVITRYSLTAHGKTINPLIYLYPDIPKDSVFEKYCKEYEPVDKDKMKIKGYIKTILAVSSYNPSPPNEMPDMHFELSEIIDFLDMFESDGGFSPCQAPPCLDAIMSQDDTDDSSMQ
ncbi:signal transducer and activator of transcription 1-alpha/beta [Oryzias melastigma]|uniref:Signal transducer and activator of transcription n=1 Tax=Oryzias melastigma TaxID=30732 RepID=A0A3B3E0N5_ORYME|nr:signal transducer and activator of transcription 1-alpha/beta [Oryzias melastigma]XP_036073436.1 signal transducer and activator of transcription 1-alpha/beta [Oryzias melastigma]